MLNYKDYILKFNFLQEQVVEVTNKVISFIKPGMSEKQIEFLLMDKLKEHNLTNHWYPILIYAGEQTCKRVSRTVHLPLDEVIIKDEDIIIIDSTPVVKTVWANWCITFPLGNNSFFKKLCEDSNAFVDTVYNFTSTKAKSLGDIYNFCNELLSFYDLQLIGTEVGHSIFQTQENVTVAETPYSTRPFINNDYADFPLRGIISIEPQLCRINDSDGKLYGAKQQRIIIFDE